MLKRPHCHQQRCMAEPLDLSKRQTPLRAATRVLEECRCLCNARGQVNNSFMHMQDSLKNSSSSAPDEDTLTSPSSESMATPHRQQLPDTLASPDKEPQSGRNTLQHPQPQSREHNKKGNSDAEKGQHAMCRHENQRQDPHSTDADFLFQHEGGQSAALLDTSATLSDWILRSAGSSAGASQRGSEAAEVAVRAEPLAAESAGAPSQLLDSLASLSDWARGGDGPRNRPAAPGGRQLGLISCLS